MRAQRLEPALAFWVDFLRQLGLLFTVVGLGLSLAVGGADAAQLLRPLSLAVWTTVAGLVFSIWLSAQFGMKVTVWADTCEKNIEAWNARRLEGTGATPAGPSRASSLTSLLDVLFILVFASLAQASAALQQAHEQPAEFRADAGPTDAGPDDAGPRDAGFLDAGPGDAEPEPPALPTPAAVRERAYEQVLEQARGRELVLARIDAAGVLVSIEREGAPAIPVGVPLLAPAQDAKTALASLAYSGATDSGDGVCDLVRAALDVGSLERYLVVMATEAPTDELPESLFEGLSNTEPRDCLRTRAGLAVWVRAEMAIGAQERVER